ncbi:MAG TPA: hypothetical protein VL307_15855 [Chitinophagaceae bacterium]|nr:hypothetical protein [Chitinophagaceae bacterium]
MTNLLSPEEYESSLVEPMTDITGLPNTAAAIWPYVEELVQQALLPAAVAAEKKVEMVYRNGNNSFHHVLLPTGNANTFIVLLTDPATQTIRGHYPLNLNEVYGIE